MTELLKMQLSNKGIVLEKIDVDFNKLFSLSYTFDNLKLIMKTLLENQNIMSSKINELEKTLHEHKEQSNNHINSLEKKIKSISNKKDISHIKTKQKIIIEKEKIFEKEKIIEKNKENKENKENKDNKDNKENEDNKDNKENKENKDNKDNKDNKEDKENKENINKIDKIESKDNKNQEENKDENNQEINIINKKNQEDYLFTPISGSKSGGEEINEEYDNQNYDNNEEIDNLREKVESLEQRLNTFEINSKLNPSNLLNEGNNHEDIQLLKINLKSFEDKFKDYNTEKEQMKKDLEDVKVKVVDFNIYELFKDCKTSDGSLDVSKLLVMNLEEKFIKKTTIMDERIKKNEEDMYNMKNDFQNVKNKSDVINNSLNGFKNSVKEISEQVGKTNDENSNMVNETNNKINEVYKKILQKIEEEKKNNKKNLEKIKTQIKKLNENVSEESIKQNEVKDLSDSDLRCLAELTKRISDLERQVKILYHGLDLSKTKEDIAKIENELNQKINEKDFFELNDKVNLQNTVTNNIKEMLERVQDISNKNSKDINFFLRKLESVTSNVIAFKAALEALSGVKNENIFDPTRYLDVNSFNDFIKSYKKDLEKIDRNIDDVRRLIANMTEVIKTKVNAEDMKSFENLMNNKLEEIKLLFTRKFADKIDTSKNFKYLDAQIKHITHICMKRNDKNESWLIAKKPIGGYSCASCEAYIGDLKEKSDYLVWNKYPNREKEQNYRLGNGFSHILNMLNIDMKNQNQNQDYSSKEFNYESDDEMHRTAMVGGVSTKIKNLSKINMMSTMGRNGFNRSNILPKIIGSKNDEVGNMTSENLEGINDQLMQGNIQLNSNEENNLSNNPRQPHIVKIYKKNKYSAPDINRIDK